ncbi:MAG: DNA replication initiation control protein YabA [Clostridia bacterium]|nr:DNA replication initiation control protein YabA [Clostridia bacterium]
MTLLAEFKLWQEKLQALQKEGEELMARIEELERQNAELRRRLAEGDYEGDGFEALTKLYEEGFHICPGNFGRGREEDCLFCLNFLLHKGKK